MYQSCNSTYIHICERYAKEEKLGIYHNYVIFMISVSDEYCSVDVHYVCRKLTT